jgi:hypothetical protein
MEYALRLERVPPSATPPTPPPAANGNSAAPAYTLTPSP